MEKLRSKLGVESRVPGGSAANVIKCIAGLSSRKGRQCAFIGKVSDRHPSSVSRTKSTGTRTLSQPPPRRVARPATSATIPKAPRPPEPVPRKRAQLPGCGHRAARADQTPAAGAAGGRGRGGGRVPPAAGAGRGEAAAVAVQQRLPHRRVRLGGVRRRPAHHAAVPRRRQGARPLAIGRKSALELGSEILNRPGFVDPGF